jgi:hypothetical protein
LESLNYQATADYLQSILAMPPARLANGHRDLGWSCSEHALTLSLALIDCGIPCVVAQGELYIVAAEYKEHVANHYFVLDHQNQVFDSSIRFLQTSGIFPQNDSSACNVRLTLTLPGGDDLQNERHTPDRPPLVWYVQKLVYDPLKHQFIESQTPFGKMLTTAVGAAHPYFWTVLARQAANILQCAREPSLTWDGLIEQTIRAARRTIH